MYKTKSEELKKEDSWVQSRTKRQKETKAVQLLNNLYFQLAFCLIKMDWTGLVS